MVKQGDPERQFYFGAVVYGDYLDLALLMPDLEDRINEAIDLTAYTDRVAQVYFAPLLVPELTEDYQAERHYDEESKELLLLLPIAVDTRSTTPARTFVASLGQLLQTELTTLELGSEVLGEKICEIFNDFPDYSEPASQ